MDSGAVSRLKTLPVRQRRPKPSIRNTPPIDRAIQLIHKVCCLAGSADLLNETRNGGDGPTLRSAISQHDTAALFNWLVAALSFQGISDQVAADYVELHGSPTWADIGRKVGQGVTCPKLKTYWHFQGCRCDKLSWTCSEPEQIEACPLPSHYLRNGRLNQMTYSLFLFIRDIADGDLVGWIDRQLQAASEPANPDRLAIMQEALIGPLREVYGVSDKVLTMTLSIILMAAPDPRKLWQEVGASMIAIDTLVHNFLVRTGILSRFRADHSYGVACYQPGGCADIIEAVSRQIDARQFNRDFPQPFPRFVQHAIWRYCSQSGLDICNGNRIDDRKSCRNQDCQLYSKCSRISRIKAAHLKYSYV